MKLKSILLLILLATIQLGNAQTADKKIALGVNLTSSKYIGDLGGNAWSDYTHSQYFLGYFSGGLSLATYLNPSFDLGVLGNYGTYGTYTTSTKNFLSTKFDASLFAHYKLNNGYILDKNSSFSPFISLGLGLASYGKVSGYENRADITGTDFIIPLGAGVKYQINDNIAIQYQYIYNFTNRDNHDMVSSGSNDAFGEHLFGVIFNLGKMKDSDNDGVADKYDLCPNTPPNVKVDAKGCPIDSDNDGVADYLDKCPNTPACVKVDANGCPIDSDKDGVPDYLDKCPDTPAGVAVDSNGCPIDTDKDGVPDYLDKCPDTPSGVAVDATGCPIDTDKDGVPDYLDKCPNTPAGVAVDVNGCPLDRDGDGIPDYLDKCPNVPGIAANKGCPEVKANVIKILDLAIKGIQFETGKDIIKKSSYPILNKVVKVMKENTNFNLDINGHTDNKGNAAKNLDLSQRRANAVQKYLTDKGINAARLTAKGYGDTLPITTNKTAQGRTKNRRVEFKINF